MCSTGKDIAEGWGGGGAGGVVLVVVVVVVVVLEPAYTVTDYSFFDLDCTSKRWIKMAEGNGGWRMEMVNGGWWIVGSGGNLVPMCGSSLHETLIGYIRLVPTLQHANREVIYLCLWLVRLAVVVFVRPAAQSLFIGTFSVRPGDSAHWDGWPSG